jgi:hypothetical protein
VYARVEMRAVKRHLAVARAHVLLDAILQVNGTPENAWKVVGGHLLFGETERFHWAMRSGWSGSTYRTRKAPAGKGSAVAGWLGPIVVAPAPPMPMLSTTSRSIRPTANWPLWRKSFIQNTWPVFIPRRLAGSASLLS